MSASWPKQPPEFGVRPGLRSLQPSEIEYRGFYLSPSISTVLRATNQDKPTQGTGILWMPTGVWRALPGPNNHQTLVCGPDYMACSRRDSNIGGFISHLPLAASLAPFDIGHRNPVYADRSLACAAWPEHPPKFGVRPRLRGLQLTGVEYRRFYLPPSISSIGMH